MDTPAALQVTQDHVSHPDLVLQLHGPGGRDVKKSHHPEAANDPHYLWSGNCKDRWAVTYAHKKGPAILSGPRAEIRFRTKNFKRTLYVIMQSSNGWIVSRKGVPPSADWKTTGLRISGLHFDVLDMKAIARGAPCTRPDLSAVSAVGFTDLQPGGSSQACSRVDWIEVWADAPEKGMNVVKAVDGYQFYEGGTPVCFYHTKPNSWQGKWCRANYIHPLMGLDGRSMTDDFPKDHPHHRGIFWAWHQVLVQGKKMGDMWSCDNFNWVMRPVLIDGGNGRCAGLTARIQWTSPAWADGKKPFVQETLQLKVHAFDEGCRCLDIQISLRALVDDVKIGGAENEKGYGGFSARIPLPKDLAMTGPKGKVTPDRLAVAGGAWLNFTGSFHGTPSGFAVLSHPDNPMHPPGWILRNANSCQNPVYPGRHAIPLSREKPLMLRYRILLHKDADLPACYKAYCDQE